MVTTNVGGGFGGQARHEGMLQWAQSARVRKPLVVFAQEVPRSGWLEVWQEAGYDLILGPNRKWEVRSALITDPRLKAQAVAFENSHYHGSYVSTATARTPLGEVVLCSAHASPNKAELGTYGWSGDAPTARHGGGDPRYVGNVLWDSDLVLASLKSLAARGLPLLAAGDLNEAIGYDRDPTSGKVGTWGKEYFAAVADAGLLEHLSTAWKRERPTRGDLQLDRVIVNEQGLRLLASGEPELDAAWQAPNAHGRLSDHRAVWVPLDATAWIAS
jgi:hypothetical protein